MTQEHLPVEGDRFPRFLEREERAPQPLILEGPPPLPASGADLGSSINALVSAVRPKLAEIAPLLTPTAGAIVVMLAASVALLTAKGHSPKADESTAASDAVTKPRDVAKDIADAVAVVAAFEARVGYAAHLGAHLTDTAEIRNALAFATTPVADSIGWEMSDAVALLVLRKLPPNVTFLAGAPAGDGAWAIPSDDSDTLAMSLGEGFDRPVRADVEKVSRAGLSLGTLHLKLVKPAGDKIATASPADPASPEFSSPKPAKKKRRIRRVYMSAEDPSFVSDRPRPSDAYRPRAIQRPRARASEAGKEQQGLFSKFFAWLKSGQKNASDNGNIPPTGLGFQQR
jgi:hypothetical protein